MGKSSSNREKSLWGGEAFEMKLVESQDPGDYFKESGSYP